MASQAELAQIRRALNELSRAATGDMQQVWDELKTTDRMAVSKALTNGWTWVLEKYGAAASQLAADFFEVEAERLNLRSRLLIAPPADGDRATARLGWALSTADQWGNTQVLLDELVKQPYRSTFQNSAHASGAGWARVPEGSHTCAFCLMLASRGAVYRSAKVAEFGYRGNKYHGKCDCGVVMVRDDSDYPDGYNPGDLYDQYRQGRKDAASGDPHQILAAMRERFDIDH